MPSALPSHAQNKRESLRKSDRSGRRITTLSFEQIDRSKRGIFTENISSSSRLPRPAYVVREDDVIGANMPDTIKLSKHRSKIYVGLSDIGSSHSSGRTNRTVSRERTSAATTLSRASIIDWTDNGSDVGASAGLSGEFSATLPAVPRVKTTLDRPPPGLETAEILNYRSVIHKRRGENRSPRPPPSRGNSKHAPVPRPPHNTPFPALARPDEFAAMFRKGVTPRKTPLDNCNVVLLGGSITPLASSREARSKSKLYREPSLLDSRRSRKEAQHPLAAQVGLPRFDLPMIDLKCVESPIADLGDLEEKGIRLVKLRRVKKKRSRDAILPNSDRNAPAGEGGADEEAIAPEEVHDHHPSQPATAGSPTSPPKTPEDVKEMKEKVTIKSEALDTNRLQSSITTPSSNGDRKKNEENEANDVDELLLTNREPYTTPLLPDIDTTPRHDNLSKSPKNPLILSNRDKIKSPLVSAIHKEVLNVPVTGTALRPVTNTENKSQESCQIVLMVEKTDLTPTPTPVLPIPPEPEPDPDDDEVLVPGIEGMTTHRRFKKRSSSLLTVPDSLCLTEHRPPAQDGSEACSGLDLIHDDSYKELTSVVDAPGMDEGEWNLAEEMNDGRRSTTVATQTSPPDGDWDKA